MLHCSIGKYHILIGDVIYLSLVKLRKSALGVEPVQHFGVNKLALDTERSIAVMHHYA